jgi:thiopeptide-type bacteriocin biosynthesis protein
LDGDPKRERRRSATRVRSFCPAGFFAWRTPLLPFDELLALSADLAAPNASPAALEDALAADRASVRARIAAVVRRPEVREAVFLASPSLDERLPAWERNEAGESGVKVERALLRYVARMAARPTPFGLFAGCSIGRVAGETTALSLSARSTYQRHTRLDMDYVFALTEALAREEALRDELVYRPNSSLYQVAGRLRYAEARLDGKIRTYHLVAVTPSEHLVAALARARGGARRDELATPLVGGENEVTLDEALEFVDELVDAQLLIHDLAPPLTGDEPIHGLIQTLERSSGGLRFVAPLVAVREGLAAIDAAGVGGSTERYRGVAAALEALPAPVELPRLYQVDLTKPTAAATLGRRVVDEIEHAVELLHRFAPAAGDHALSRFRQRFLERYEGRTMPLSVVLDEESGLGFDAATARPKKASPLLEKLILPAATDETVRWRAPERHLMRRLAAAYREGVSELVLDEKDVAALSTAERPPPLPDSFAVMATLSGSPESIDDDFELCIRGIGGPSGANLLGRFCHSDPELTRELSAYLRAEEAIHEDAIFAEVIHLPEGRVGNVLLRPILRPYEIPFLGRAGVDEDHQIPLTDLLVSVERGEIVLRSQRLGRRIVPRLTSAHNFTLRALGVYHFLCALQNQGTTSWLGFDWGGLADAPYLPRVRAGRLILSLARWRIDKGELEPIVRARPADAFARLKALRTRLSLPRWVAVEDGDNVLPIDLDNALWVDVFLQLVKERSAVQLVELYPPPNRLCARGPEGLFTHELVVPFLRVGGEPNSKKNAAGSASKAGPSTAIRLVPSNEGRRLVDRSFPPGSRWLYLKLYAGTETIDELLAETVRPLVKELAPARWFFLRYGDPEWHLRLRFHGEPMDLLGRVLPAAMEAIRPHLDEGRVSKVMLDTYEREIERYGGVLGVELAEELFHHDSEAVLEIVSALSRDDDRDARWRLYLRGIDDLLDAFGFSLDDKRAILTDLRKSFGEEFRVTTVVEKQLGEKYRPQKLELESLLDRSNDERSPYAVGFEILRRRGERIADVCQTLRAAEAGGKLTTSLRELAFSYVHMHANRMFHVAPRIQELVMYDFLKRLYDSSAARSRS